MKRITEHIFIILILNAFSTVYGQKANVIQTKELISIANENGLDSVLFLVNELPIYLIDKESSYKLLDFLGEEKNSYELEQFISSYSYCYRNKETRNVLIEYLEMLKNEIPQYSPNQFGILPSLSDEVYNALIKNSSSRIKDNLIEYYQLWNQKSLLYKEDYLNSKSRTGQDSILLSKPFVYCNENCYSILLALKQMNSRFYSKKLLEQHEKYLLFESGYSLDPEKFPRNLFNRNPNEIIELSEEYNSIGDINMEKELTYKEFITTRSSSCWKNLLFNGKVGFIDAGCNYSSILLRGGHGKSYRLVLKKNKLFIYNLKLWVS